MKLNINPNLNSLSQDQVEQSPILNELNDGLPTIDENSISESAPLTSSPPSIPLKKTGSIDSHSDANIVEDDDELDLAFTVSEPQKLRKSSTASLSRTSPRYPRRMSLERSVSETSPTFTNGQQANYSKQVYFRHLTQLRHDQLIQEPTRLETKLTTLQRTITDTYQSQLELMTQLGTQLREYKTRDHESLNELLNQQLNSKLVATGDALTTVQKDNLELEKSYTNLHQTLLPNHAKLQTILNSPDLLLQLIRRKRWLESIQLARYLADQLPSKFKANPSKLVDQLKAAGENGLDLIAKGLFIDLNYALQLHLNEKTSQVGESFAKVKKLVQYLIALQAFETIELEQLVSVIIIGKYHDHLKLVPSNDLYLSLHLKLFQLLAELIQTTPFENILQGVLTSLNHKLQLELPKRLNQLNQLSSINQMYKLNHPLLIQLDALGMDLKPWLEPLLTQKVLNLTHSLILTKIENFQSDDLDTQQLPANLKDKLPKTVDISTTPSPLKLVPSLKQLHNELISIWNELRFLGFLSIRERLQELVELELNGVSDWVQDLKLEKDRSESLNCLVKNLFAPYHLACLKDGIFGGGF